jgi:hypothetical protein
MGVFLMLRGSGGGQGRGEGKEHQAMTNDDE